MEEGWFKTAEQMPPDKFFDHRYPGNLRELDAYIPDPNPVILLVVVDYNALGKGKYHSLQLWKMGQSSRVFFKQAVVAWKQVTAPEEFNIRL